MFLDAFAGSGSSLIFTPGVFFGIDSISLERWWMSLGIWKTRVRLFVWLWKAEAVVSVGVPLHSSWRMILVCLVLPSKEAARVIV